MSNNSEQSNIYNLQLEQIVLGAILLNEENYWNVSEILTLDLFGSDDHQKIFAIIHELACDGRAIRVPIVAGRIGSLAEGKDPEAYVSMLLHVASREESIPLKDYALELRSSSTRRKVIALAENMIKTAKDIKYDADQIVDRASERLADISRQAAIEHESTVSGTIGQIYQKASDSKSMLSIRPCLKGLEKMVGQFPSGSLVLWGGPPGSGKTAMAMQQMLFSSTVHPTSLFELEMDNVALVARSIAGETGVSMRDIMRGLTDDQYDALIAAQKSFANRLMRIVSPSKMTIQQIRSRAYAHKRKFGLDLLAVDHLKLVERPSKVRMDPVERAYENARDLKALAKDLNCVVIGLCQFTKAARQKEQPEPEMEDFYGGSLEEHADIMLANFNRNDWLKRNPPMTNAAKTKEDYDGKLRMSEGKIEVYKLKDRFGPSRDRHIFDWDGKITQFKDQEFQTQGSFLDDEPQQPRNSRMSEADERFDPAQLGA
ncbi:MULTISPECIES: replicative DNA helicase [Agrobacterium]|uniref:replicative DNA helicase n=2 Tax=Pseudomonadota TaxID=1224 RepID=UPI002300E019|nr:MULTISPECIES: DnaB-like helicase C-terminal domain-containing protein [Agrobacterium]MDA5627827.1 DnaB-like helicase C-terminal domain-containing protein [Agrobacterium sp. ST15.16.055]MDA6978427.1 DnaB-like helicase C-terminal domain-containing protein [Agrobacterium salinitolerans]